MRKKKTVLRKRLTSAGGRRERRVALSFPVGNPVLERVVGGILEFARGRGRWLVSRVPERLDLSVEWLRHWDGDGALVVLTNRRQAALARRLRMPVVNLGGYLEHPGVATVAADDLVIGRIAAEHLLERRFIRFGYFGPRGVWYSERRHEGFRGRAVEGGGRVEALWAAGPFESPRGWVDEREELVRWLGRLRPPVGILAGNDQRALMVLEACARAGHRVPEDVAVVGVDNDLVACEFSSPGLTSVDRDDRAHGMRAAEVLDRLMSGRGVGRGAILVAPRGVVGRASTDSVAIEDPDVALAVARAREQIGERYGVERMLDWTGLSRRALEMRFRSALGCAPYEFLNRLRVDRAKQLLSGPDRLTLQAVASACGFGEARRMREVFRRVAGMGPLEFRRLRGVGVIDRTGNG